VHQESQLRQNFLKISQLGIRNVALEALGLLTKPKSEAEAKLPTTLTEEIIMNSNIKTPNRIALALSTATLLTCVWAASNAFADEQVRSETVKFQDLNVNTPEGAQALYGRIHAAAKRVCYVSDSVLEQASAACARKAEGDAIQKLNMSQLTAYYKIKTGGHTPLLVAAR
jgi:UrcA family protein